MKKVLLLVLTGFIFYSCNTNPPTSPESISYPAGKVIVNTTINLEPSNTPVQKVVLLEDFANVSCVPCVTSNQILESLQNGTYENKITVVNSQQIFRLLMIHSIWLIPQYVMPECPIII